MGGMLRQVTSDEGSQNVASTSRGLYYAACSAESGWGGSNPALHLVNAATGEDRVNERWRMSDHRHGPRAESIRMIHTDSHAVQRTYIAPEVRSVTDTVVDAQAGQALIVTRP